MRTYRLTFLRKQRFAAVMLSRIYRTAYAIIAGYYCREIWRLERSTWLLLLTWKLPAKFNN